MEHSPIPIYIKLAQIILGLIGFFFILYIGKEILVPLTFATLFAILLNPLVNRLERLGLNRVLAIALSLLLGMLGTVALLYFLSFQIAHFADTFPQLKEKFNVLLKNGVNWVAETFNVSTTKVNAWIDKKEKEGLANS